MVSISSSSQAYSALAAQRQALFTKADADASGGLNIDEFKAMGEARGGKRPDSAPAVEDIFSQIDADRDGEVTASEMDLFAEANFKNRLSQGGPLSGENLLQASASFAQDLIGRADSDGNGTLSLEEFSAAKPEDAPVDGPASEDIFALLDTDSDGELTQSELESGFAQGPQAAGGPPPPPPAGGEEEEDSSTSYDPLDTNQDGEVSVQERLAGLLGDAKDLNARIAQTLQALLAEQEKLAA